MRITEQYTAKVKDLKLEEPRDVAGSVKNCKENYRNITSDTWILDSKSGARIELTVFKKISLFNYGTKKSLYSESKKKKRNQQTSYRGVIKPVAKDTKDYISSIFLTEKSNISHRPIFD